VNTPDFMDENPIYTGERVIEGATDSITWQDHIARYQFASRFARGRVLDIACGTGYGCKILLNRATTRILGIDFSQDAISEALKRYKDDRIAFVVGNILDIELPNGSQDVVTCFETIEHVAEQETAISELCRVLDPNGTLIISCPNRKVMSPGRSASGQPHNPFHVKEFSTDEFTSFLSRHFGTVTFFGQRGVNKILFLPFFMPFTGVIRYRSGSSRLESISSFKEYRFVTAVCRNVVLADRLHTL
jgi:ubiquinone/menaquinone biosynthesis C-methylase UbiE